MAEQMVFVVDVNSSMNGPSGASQTAMTKLEMAVKCMNLIVNDKILHKKNDEVGLVLFGTNDTSNALAEDDQYQNITVKRELGPANLDFLRMVEDEIHVEDAEGDAVDALVVGMELLVSAAAGSKKRVGSKRIVLFTDASTDFSVESLDDILQGFKHNDVSILVVTMDVEKEDGTLDEDKLSKLLPVQAQGIRVLKKIANSVDGELYSFNHAFETVNVFRKRVVKQVTIFRGCLEVADFKIPLYAYNRVRRQAVPTMKKISGLVSTDPSNPSAGSVEREVTYHKQDEAETEVPGSELVKAFKYGKDLIPWQPEFDEAVGLKVEKRLSTICFTHKDNVFRWHHMGDSAVSLTHPPGDLDAATALSALCQAMEVMDTVAIVRAAWRNNSTPKLGMLFPHIKEDYSCLMFVRIPFREDIRLYKFPSLNNNPLARVTDEQKDAMDAFIDKMDLMEAQQDEDGDFVEALQPKKTFNPAIQMLYQCAQHRALNPDEPLPELDPMIAEYIKPNQKLLKDSKEAVEELKKKFKLIVQETKPKETAAGMWKSSGPGDEQEAKRPKTGEDASGDKLSMESLIRSEVNKVGSVSPVEDFLAIISRKTEDLLVPAARQLMDRVYDLVEVYVGGDTGKFEDMVRTLRRELCSTEPKLFNTFLRELKFRLEQFPQQRQPFIDILRRGNITLVSTEESPESDASKAEADSFWAAAAAIPASVPEPADDDMDDMFEEL